MRTLLLCSLGLIAACSKGMGDAPLADAAVATYAPQGCAYTVTPPDARGFTEFALDDTIAAAGDPGDPAPLRVRLGLGGTTASGMEGYANASTTAAFTWETKGATHAARVRLGSSPDALTDVHAGYSWTTPAGIGSAANMHEAHACNLTAGKTYYYQVGGGPAGAEKWSATQSFTTVPSSGKVTIGLSGDSRDSADIFQLVQGRMRDAGASAQVFSGDLVLFGAQEDVYAQWLDKAWKDPMDSTKFLTLGQQLILPVPGNHENSSAQFYGNFALPGDGPFAESFSSVNLGSAHLVLLDDQAIAVSPTGEAAMAQLAWLEEDLARAEQNRKDQPFIVVVHHRGELSTSTHAPDADVGKTREALMPVWDKHHVDLVLNGHDHNYERSKPVTGPAKAPVVAASSTAGTTYVVCAGAGASAYAPGGGTVAYREKNVAFGMGTPYVGVYSLFSVEGPKLTFTAYGLKSAGGSVMGDDVIDTFTLLR